MLPWLSRGTPATDGERLFERLFADRRLKTAWAEARGLSRRRRLRLRIDASAPELHTLPWELLRDADPGTAGADLAASADTPFSRYLAGRRHRGGPVLERPIRLLVAIADPADLEDYGLTPIDVAAEREEMTRAFSEVSASRLAVTFLRPPVTLAALDQELKKGYHVLHVVAHGVRPKGEAAALFLAGDDGRVADVSECQLAEMLGRQGGALRLVYLSSCQSAARSPADAFRGIAPSLIEAGVPAVLAMQDQVPVDTARAFSSSFYRRLLVHGLVDLAANEARSTVASAGLPGPAIPVLFQRLRSGQLLAKRGKVFGKSRDSFWSVLLDNVADGECTPLLGPRATVGLLPSHGDLARALAREHAYPLAGGARLAQVAQYVATIDDVRLRKSVVRRLAAGLKRHLGLQPEPADRRAGLSETAAEIGWADLCRERDGLEIHHQLADLELPLFLTTNFDNFMTLALEAKGKRVRRESVAWHLPPGSQTGPYHDFEPPAAAQDPVVFHLFGTDEDLLSMVITEDDHLDFLARVSRDHEYLLPTSMVEALARNSLLFLGYRIADLDLKVILRGLLPALDQARWRRYHVAVQIEPGARDPAAEDDVRRYLQHYFGGSRIDVYWGTSQQFMTELHARWLELHGG